MGGVEHRDHSLARSEAHAECSSDWRTGYNPHNQATDGRNRGLPMVLRQKELLNRDTVERYTSSHLPHTPLHFHYLLDVPVSPIL